MATLAMVATSSVHAIDEPMLRGDLYEKKKRPSPSKSRSSSSKTDKSDDDGSSSRCADGKKDGKKTVDDLWKSMDENCDNAWDLDDDANKKKNKKYPRKAENRKDQEYNDCARDEVDKQVERIEKKCFDNDPSQCEDLGKTAAELVVKDNYECSQAHASGQSASKHTDYKKECRKVAYGVCEGHITSAVKTICRNRHEKVRSTSELRSLQTKCKKQVDRMTGKKGDELKIMIK